MFCNYAKQKTKLNQNNFKLNNIAAVRNVKSAKEKRMEQKERNTH